MRHEKITHIDLFSGIGGFARAADRVWSQGGVRHIFCDNEPFAQEVLRKHWPTAPIYGDIRTLTNTGSQEQRGLPAGRQDGQGVPALGQVHILTGGFPCQPFSQAGRRRGEEDDRFLWPEMCRVIGEFKPTWVIAENVRGLLTQGGGVVFERVCTDLEALGYEVQPIIIPAVAVGAPHRRDRVWFIAHNSQCGRRRTGGESIKLGTIQKGRENDSGSSTKSDTWNQSWLTVAARLCRVDDGIPKRMDRNPRLKALGNAIVPQVAEEIMRAIRASGV